MKGVREPLLWIALASFVAFLPVPQLAMPVSAALALATLLLLRTRVARLVRRPLSFACFACGSVCVLNALCIGAQMRHLPPGPALRAAELGMPLAFLALAQALMRVADEAVIEEYAAWFFASRALFLGWFLASWMESADGLVLALLACPSFAYLVLRMRGAIALPSAR